MDNKHDARDLASLGFKTSRRRMLGATCAAVGGAAVGAFGFERLARADLPLPSGRAFIFCYFPGGWDQLLFLDPRDPARFPDTDRGTTLTETGYESLRGFNGFDAELVRQTPTSALAFGPASQKPADPTRFKIADLSDRIAVVRGINMGTVGHEVGYRYFLTGKFPSGTAARGTSMATEIVGQMRPRRPLPNLAVRIETYNDHMPGSASALRVDNLNDLLLVLGPSAYQERDVVEQALADYGQSAGPCAREFYDRRGLLTAMRDARAQGEAIVRENLASRFQFASADDAASVAIRDFYRVSRGDTSSPASRAALAAQAIKTGVSQVVSITLGNGTDTHFTGNQGHANLLYPGVAALSALLHDLAGSAHPEGGTYLDHTTVLAFSEFARTPLFNNFGGRDHHIASSCLLAGAGIRGGAVVGASSTVGMGAGRYDFTRNQVSDAGENIKPDHIAATLLASAGLDPYITRVQPITALLARP